MKKSFRLRGRQSSKQQGPRSGRKCAIEVMEPRQMLTATPVGIPTLSYTAETTQAFGANSYMAVEAATHGTSSYGFLSWGFLEYGSSSAVFNGNPTNSGGYGASAVNNLSLQLYNTATSGNFQPYAGSFSVYVIPNDTVAATNVRFESGTGGASLGTSTGGESTLGITSPDSSWLVGTWNITTGLSLGYSTFMGSTTGGSTVTSGTGATGSTTNMGANAAATLKSDFNNGTPIRLAVVANDTGFAADWEGNFSSNQPKLGMDVTQAPLVSFSAPTYTVNETDQNSAHSTPATIQVDRTSMPIASTTLNWSVTAGASLLTGATSGTVTFNPGDTSAPITVHFQNLTTTTSPGSITVTLTDPGTNSPAPVLATPGSSAVVNINYIQARNVSIDAAAYSVDEATGMVAIKVDRTGDLSQTSDVTLTTANGTPYAYGNLQDPQDAQAGRDFGTSGVSAAPSFAVHFNVGDSSEIVNVSLIDVKTFGGDTRSFSATLTSPSTGTAISGTSTTTVQITDDTVANSATPTGTTSHSSGVETSGPFYTDSYTVLASTPHGSFGFSTMPVDTFGAYAAEDPLPAFTSGVFTSGVTASTVDSIKLSIYNSDVGPDGFGGTAGSFDVYLLTDNTSLPQNIPQPVSGTTYADDGLTYAGGTGNTGPSVIGSQGGAVYVGTATMPNNQVGYNDYVFDNLPAAVKAALTTDVNDSTGAHYIRFAITPSAGSSVAADWEGNFAAATSPNLTLLVEKASVSSLPAWVAPGSAATWDAGTQTLNVTGAATIVADPQASGDSPAIVANGAAAKLTINPTNNATAGGQFIHIASLTLTGGASTTFDSVGGARSHTDHDALVIGTGATTGTLSVDSSSKLDLVDNDLIIHHGASQLSAVQALASEGRQGTSSGLDGTWTGNGLTSSAAAAVDALMGLEQDVLAVDVNSDILTGAYANWQLGSQTETLAADDVLVKYTYNGDFTFEGEAGDDAAAVLGFYYDNGATTGHGWGQGGATWDGKVDNNDAAILGFTYGLGVTNGPRL